MDQTAIVEIVACFVSIVAIIISGLTSKLWFVLWDIIEKLRLDISTLRESFNEFRVEVAKGDLKK